jgi:dephospho-CoA kinase
MFKVGLTGGIGAGKTTVTQIFAELGVPIIDADTVAHALVAKGQPALTQIQQAFGEGIVTTGGRLNRSKLRDIIFADNAQKQRLEAILHPLVYASLQRQVDALKTPYCILAIPLLFETKMTHFVDRIVVVDCPVECQIQRVVARDQQPPEKVQAIIGSQIARAERCAKADDLIDNSFTPHKSLAEQVKTLHNLYLVQSHLWNA